MTAHVYSTDLPVDSEQPFGIPVYHAREDGLLWLAQLSLPLTHPPEVERDGNEASHLTVELGADLFQGRAELQVLLPAWIHTAHTGSSADLAEVETVFNGCMVKYCSILYSDWPSALTQL